MAAMNSIKVTVRANGQDFTPVCPKMEDEVAYPSDYLDANGLPTFQLYYHDLSKKDLLDLIWGEASEARLPSELVTAYVYKVVSEWKETLESDWSSFRFQIGKAGEKITPFNLIGTTVNSQKLADYKKAVAPEGIDEVAMVIYLLAPYRIVGIKNEDYQDRVITNIQNQLDSLGAKKLQVKALKNVTTLINSANYLKMVAVIDMFYYHFKNSQERAVVRIATLSSRHKDCAALSTLNHITSFTGRSFVQVLDWVFTDQVAKEIGRMMRAGQEIDRPESYMPYLKDLGLSRKSPYSSSANPGTHCWAQMVCAMMGSKRSQNAIASTEENLSNLTRNAEIMAYALGVGADLVKGLIIGDQKEGDSGVIQDEEGMEEPNNMEAQDWLEYMASKGFKLTPNMELQVRHMCLRITNPRKATLGSYLRERYSSSL
uniref:Nucleoprotein n=2 Tax=Perhabdovirus anguilla TaxID=1300113 RepID=A0A0A0V0A3_9RHAB|nr:nucleoprotein [Eel virus European X]AIY29167.1 nucleoprotein [Perhabdovirus anguilla]